MLPARRGRRQSKKDYQGISTGALGPGCRPFGLSLHPGHDAQVRRPALAHTPTPGGTPPQAGPGPQPAPGPRPPPTPKPQPPCPPFPPYRLPHTHPAACCAAEWSGARWQRNGSWRSRAGSAPGACPAAAPPGAPESREPGSAQREGWAEWREGKGAGGRFVRGVGRCRCPRSNKHARSYLACHVNLGVTAAERRPGLASPTA